MFIATGTPAITLRLKWTKSLGTRTSETKLSGAIPPQTTRERTFQGNMTPFFSIPSRKRGRSIGKMWPFHTRKRLWQEPQEVQATSVLLGQESGRKAQRPIEAQREDSRRLVDYSSD